MNRYLGDSSIGSRLENDNASFDETLTELEKICPDINIRLTLEASDAFILQSLLDISREMKMEIAESEIKRMINEKKLETFGILRKTLFHTDNMALAILNSAPKTGVDLDSLLTKMLGGEIIESKRDNK